MIPNIKDAITEAQEVMFVGLRMLFESEGPLTLESMKKIVTDQKELCLRLNLIDRCVKNIRDLGRTAAMVDGNNDLPYEDIEREIEGEMMAVPPRRVAPIETQDALGGIMGFLQNTVGSMAGSKRLEELANTLNHLNEIKNLTIPEKAKLNTIKTTIIERLESSVADYLKPKASASEFDVIQPPPEAGTGDHE